jgi:hypothetical protein
MKKAEMEQYHAEYDSRMGQSEKAHQQGIFRKAVQWALTAVECVDGMIQYERNYTKTELSRIRALDMVLGYAPSLLDFISLEKVGQLLAECRRIEKNVATDYAKELAKAESRMWQSHRLLDHLERNAGCMQDELRQLLGGDQDSWRRIAEGLEEMGLLRRTREGGSYRLALMTQMQEVVKAKCQSCGAVTEGPKVRFLEQVSCSRCQQSVLFVILSPD